MARVSGGTQAWEIEIGEDGELKRVVPKAPGAIDTSKGRCYAVDLGPGGGRRLAARMVELATELAEGRAVNVEGASPSDLERTRKSVQKLLDAKIAERDGASLEPSPLARLHLIADESSELTQARLDREIELLDKVLADLPTSQ